MGTLTLPAARCATPSIIRSSLLGFTLVELLVALVVMGIALGLVVPQLMPDERSQLNDEARRLALLLENAGLQARASGRTMAWNSDGQHYRFWRKNDYGDWVRIEDDPSFRARNLPAGIRIASVEVAGLPLSSGEYLALSANSFALPFRIDLVTGSISASVHGESTGNVTAKIGDRDAQTQ